MRRLTCLSLAVTALLQGVACSCSGDAEPGTSSDGAGAAGAESAATTTSGGGGNGGGDGGQGGGTGTSGGGGMGAGGTGGAGTGGTGGSGAGGAGGATYGYCAKGCITPADCCAPGQGDCPSDRYPTNYTCENGICGTPECERHSDCTSEGLDPNKQCVITGGLKLCATPCTEATAEEDCSGAFTCTGIDDAGNRFCWLESEPFVCDDDEECNGTGECVDGACVCNEDSDCTSDFADACAL